MAEQMAKADGYWIPMMLVFDLGVHGPSCNENDTYVADDCIYKVNSLMNSGGIVALLENIARLPVAFPAPLRADFCLCMSLMPVIPSIELRSSSVTIRQNSSLVLLSLLRQF